MGRKRLVKEIEFKVGKGRCLIILYGLLPKMGLDRVVIENKDGAAHVYATGRSRFEFRDNSKARKSFLISNPGLGVAAFDFVISSFWGQFTFGELFVLQKDNSFQKSVENKLKELVREFEFKAAEELNGLVAEKIKRFKKTNKKGEA